MADFYPWYKSVRGYLNKVGINYAPGFFNNPNTALPTPAAPAHDLWDMSTVSGTNEINIVNQLPISEWAEWPGVRWYNLLAFEIWNNDFTSSGDAIAVQGGFSKADDGHGRMTYAASFRLCRINIASGTLVAGYTPIESAYHGGGYDGSTTYITFNKFKLNDRECSALCWFVNTKAYPEDDDSWTNGQSFWWEDSTVWGFVGENEHLSWVLHDDPNEDDGGGNSGGGGGGGDHDDESDKIEEGDETDLEGISATNAGFVTLYKITMAQLQTLADEIYTDNVWQIVKNWWNKPNDMIAGLMLLPITPAGGTVYKPKVGLHTFNVSLPIVAKQYKEVDCGSLYIAEYYGGALDYSPYSRIQIYLPFIGLKELDVDEVMGKWLYVKYRIDVYNGDCIAFVKIGDGTAGNASIHYTFTGNCGQQIPTSGADFSAVINGCIQFATVAVASIISAGAAGAAAGAAGSAAAETGAVAAESAATAAQSVQAAANLKAAGDISAAGVNAVMNAKPRVERSGSIGCSLGQMGVLKPFIIRTIPRQSLPTGYKSFEGYPSNISGTLSSFAGYTVVDTVKLKGIPATDSEIAEIERALKGGVYL